MTPPPLKLGSLELKSPFILAPLESVSDCAFRRLCFTQGAGLTWTEMIRARGVTRNNKSTLDLIDSHDADVLTGVQLMVTNERETAEALAALDALAATTHPHFKNLRAVDLNFGCPSPAVIKIGAGPALIKRRTKLRAIFEALRSWKEKTALPIGAVGAKIRLGLHGVEAQQKVYLGAVEVANDLLDYLVVHARHARQTSSEPAAWSALAEVKAHARIPIIGNGDVFSPADAQRLFRDTGCDGALIARGAIRSPWIFRELRGAGGPVTSAELDAAEQSYFETAEGHHTKEKFLTWHREGFARMRARLTGQPKPGADLPANEHMQ